MRQKNLYIFLDESGNLDFSSKGSRHFIISSLSTQRPFDLFHDLATLKYDLIESTPSLDLEYFHASNDSKKLRQPVFEQLSQYAQQHAFQLNTVILEKTQLPQTYQTLARFYPRLLGHLLQTALTHQAAHQFDEIIIITDTIPQNKRRKSIEKAIKTTLAEMLPNIRFRIMHHASKSTFGLQAVDYCCWAMNRKWQSADETMYELIKKSIQIRRRNFSEYAH